MKHSLLVLSIVCSAPSLAATNNLSDTLPIIASQEIVLFPEQITTFYIDNDHIIRGVDKAISTDGFVLVLAAKPQTNILRSSNDAANLYEIGTVGMVLQVTPLSDGTFKVLVQGISRALVHDLFVQQQIIYADIEHLTYGTYDEYRVQELFKNIKELVNKASKYNLGEFASLVHEVANPEKLAAIVTKYLSISIEQAQKLLEASNYDQLMQELYNILSYQLGSLVMQDVIMNDSMVAMKENEKKYILQEQLKAIKKKLNQNDPDDLATILTALPLPQEIRKEVDRQLARLDQMPSTMPEYSIIQGYLEWITELPWGVETDDNLDIFHAKTILDDDHFGLKDIKERILDYIAIRKLTKDNAAPILCFVGPPGTGKTSLAKSIARSLGRNFQRISVGGVHDESEIRGHRRTYVAAMPGRIIDSIRKAGSINPVILIDEIDKVGHNSIHGDPSSALLEVLDPEQNNAFRDHYLGTTFDLSNVLFIATANTLSTMPRPLLDRMEIIEVSGYDIDEKIAIARNYLIKKAMSSAGIEGHPLTFSRETLIDLIEHYTFESGVRELERVLKKLCAKAARALIEDNTLISFTQENLEQYLGPYKYIKSDVTEQSQVGIANGLAANSFGGKITKVEALIMPGTGKLILTGSIGDVMKESANAALSYARAHAHEYAIAPEVFKENDMHIHFPAGAQKKDGPSAGIALLSSIVSALTERKINADYAMTGEINLRGNVMPIGGVKEKLLAAKRNEIRHLILPEQNKRDLVGIEDLTKGIDIIFVKHATEVLSQVLLPKEQPQ